MSLSIDESKLSEEDRANPTIQLLLEIIRQQAEEIQRLKDEINRLKNNPRKPKIRPSNLEKKKKSKSNKGKRAGSEKKIKTAKLTIHDNQEIEPDHIPAGSGRIMKKEAFPSFMNIVKKIAFSISSIGLIYNKIAA
jgi:hypothetical protein